MKGGNACLPSYTLHWRIADWSMPFPKLWTSKHGIWVWYSVRHRDGALGGGVYSHNSGSILPVADKADAKKGVWIIKPTSQELLCFWLNLLKFRSNIRYLTSMWDVFFNHIPQKSNWTICGVDQRFILNDNTEKTIVTDDFLIQDTSYFFTFKGSSEVCCIIHIVKIYCVFIFPHIWIKFIHPGS